MAAADGAGSVTREIAAIICGLAGLATLGAGLWLLAGMVALLLLAGLVLLAAGAALAASTRAE